MAALSADYKTLIKSKQTSRWYWIPSVSSVSSIIKNDRNSSSISYLITDIVHIPFPRSIHLPNGSGLQFPEFPTTIPTHSEDAKWIKYAENTNYISGVFVFNIQCIPEQGPIFPHVNV